jgi:hypothetical protein
MITDDSRIYANLATNWLQHGIYGQTPDRSRTGVQRSYRPTRACRDTRRFWRRSSGYLVPATSKPCCWRRF